LGDTNETDTGDVYDTKLVEAVNHAKMRYGLKPDSLITNNLINEINIPAKKRIEQLMVNMERMRWVTGDTSSNELILVNIPEYTLHYFEDNKEVWSCNVVVGKPMTKTVIFSGKMQYVVFSPYWNVPPSIINAEVIPGMRRNKNYLARHNMEWNGGRVRQKPGPSNSLGLVKFLFPNSNNIYLHDTPSKSLFSEDNRAFSHGCIRVAKPRDLAIRVLQQMPEWTTQKIDAAMHAGKEQYVTLKKTIPVYIGYFTAFMSSDGQLNFRTDVYKRDASLLEMLMQN
jgi:murein L,D-transpeptidase YcbB/YkuD